MLKELYYVAIIPPAGLYEQVDFIRKKLSEYFGFKAALKSPPHITLVAPVHLGIEEVEELTLGIEMLLEKERAFSLKLGEVSWFGFNTVFLSLHQNDDLKRLEELHKKATNMLPTRLTGKRDQKFHPHMTLANRDVEKHQKVEVVEVLALYKNSLDKIFANESIYKNICIFKHNGKTWEVHKEYNLSL